jgi:hypothetical protein
MARVFIDGFEHGAVDLWSPKNNLPLASADLVNGFLGSYSAHFPGTGHDYGMVHAFASTLSQQNLSFRINFDQAAFGVKQQIAYFVDSDSAYMAALVIDETGFLCIYTGELDGGTLVAQGATPLVPYKTYRIEIKYIPLTSGGTSTVWVDGAQQVTYSGNTTAGLEAIAAIGFGCGDAADGFNGYLDDIVCDDSDYIGSSYICAIIPNAVGTTTQWTPLSGTNFQNVNSVPPDDNKYVYTNTSAIDTYKCTGLPANAIAVKSVQVQGRIKTAP